MTVTNPATDQLRRDLAFSESANRADAEAVVFTTQATVRKVLLEIERLRDRVDNPQYHIERFTHPVPELKLTEEEKNRPNPVPVIPWRDYGKSRQG